MAIVVSKALRKHHLGQKRVPQAWFIYLFLFI
jgi:hypothetical protein